MDFEDKILPDITYLIVFSTNGNILNKSFDDMIKINENIFDDIYGKLKIYKPLKFLNIFNRDIHESQTRDKNTSFEYIYTNEYIYVSRSKQLYLIEYKKNMCEQFTFPNLNKYDMSYTVNQKILKIDNIDIIMENNHIYIQCTNPNINKLTHIIDTINEFL